MHYHPWNSWSMSSGKMEEVQDGLDPLFFGNRTVWDVWRSLSDNSTHSDMGRSSGHLRLDHGWWWSKNWTSITEVWAVLWASQACPLWFNHRVQEAGKTYDQYQITLCKLAEGCDSQTITPDDISRDRLVFGIKDAKVRGAVTPGFSSKGRWD